MNRMTIGFIVFLATVGEGHATDAVATAGSAQATGLFRLACLDHAGEAKATRDFLGSHGIPRMPAQAAADFLQSRAGVVFDASARGIRLAVASEDDGACTVFADHADTADVHGDLKTLLHGLGVPFIVAHDRDDPQQPAVRHRDYHLKIGGNIYSAIISTDEVPGHIQAFMTLVPRNPADVVPQDDALGK